jgi:hypothetical protein
MNALALLTDARDHGVKVTVDGDRLILEGDGLTDEMVARFKASKPEILRLLISVPSGSQIGSGTGTTQGAPTDAPVPGAGTTADAAAIGELAPSLKEHKADVMAHIHGQVTGKILPFILPAPDARALLGHCTRVRPGTSTTDPDVEALGAYFASLTREKAIASERRCWAWWKATPVPTVGEFLAREPRAKGGAA